MTMKTIREATRGKLTLRLLQVQGGYSGVVIGGAGGRPTLLHGTDPDEVWQRLQSEAVKADGGYFGFDGARMRFRRFFPDGFATPRYAEEERTYKLAAKARLDATVPLAKATTGTALGEAVRASFNATNLLSPFEKTRLQDVLRGPA